VCVCVEAMGGEGKGCGKEMEGWGNGRDGGPEVAVGKYANGHGTQRTHTQAYLVNTSHSLWFI
jgi:hypothetical protein